jgi:rRNA-processing protein FCF1
MPVSKPDEAPVAPKSKQKTEADIFALESVFPDAGAVFTSRPKTLEEVKGDAIVILDTNTLLLPYMTGPKTLSEIKATYKKLLEKKRLLIPARVAREFADNRAKKLGELFQKLTSQQAQQHSFLQENYPLLENIEEYTRLQEEAKKIGSMVKSFQKTLAAVVARVESWEWNDPISLLY